MTPGTEIAKDASLVVVVEYQAPRTVTWRMASRDERIAARIRLLGWFLVASIVRPTIEVYASHKLWATMADSSMPRVEPVWTLLFAGLALLSLARIMGVGTAMREDLEGVV